LRHPALAAAEAIVGWDQLGGLAAASAVLAPAASPLPVSTY
jgi:hypothetical protein